VFAIGQDGLARSKRFTGDTWDSRWLVLSDTGAQFNQTARVAAVSRSAAQMEVFAVGQDGLVRGRHFTDGWEDGWEVLCGAQFNQAARLAATSFAGSPVGEGWPRWMAVFAVGQDGIIRGRRFTQATVGDQVGKLAALLDEGWEVLGG